MTKKYLLAAEADKIQDFIFRASRLREVVGGSQLLTRLCDEGAVPLAKHYGGEKIISDGGAFLFEFDDEDKAKKFKRDLAELYRRCAGGNLTEAKIVEFDDVEFKNKNKEAKESLRQEKNKGDVAVTAVHLPYIAFCASCGLAFAKKHEKKIEADPRGNYICSDCLNKTKERFAQRKTFLNDFRKAVLNITDDKEVERLLDEPKKNDWTDSIGKLDPRNYVAYLVADGNSMGKLFDKCDKEQLKNLSLELTNVLRESLAEPCRELLRKQADIAHEQILPIVPLILGGDDLFALLPARWALDLTRRFCVEYEKRLKEVLAQAIFIGVYDKNKLPTISASVVICKSSYPHTLAYNRAKKELNKAKQLTRRIEVERQSSKSSISFALITGHRMDETSEEKKDFCSTLQPYFINEDNPDKDLGISIEHLCELRLKLKDLPAKRRAELKDLFDAVPQSDDDLDNRWLPKLKTLLKRMEKTDAVRAGLKNSLGATVNDDSKLFWHKLYGRKDSFTGSLMSDLLMMWSYAYKADEPLSNYEGE